MVSEDAVEHLGLGFGDRLVGFGDLLQVVDPGRERVEVALRGSDPEHVKDDLGVPRIVLVPAIVECFSGAGQSQ